MSKLCIVDEELYSHESLWRSSTALASRLGEDVDDSHHLTIPALLMAFLAYEAFVNFAGHVVLPCLWADERKSFKGKGIEGKLSAIVGALPSFNWKKGEPPYQNVHQLETFRDLVAHGKVVVTRYKTIQQRDGSHFRFEHTWDEYLSEASVLEARRDVQAFCQSLVVALRQVSDHPHLLFNVFEGPVAAGESMSET
jgi:hypothetical protein